MRSVWVVLFAFTVACGSSSDGDGNCPDGFTSCDGQCINITSDNTNCGGCGVTCEAGEVCSMGGCAVSCAEPLLQCGGGCVDPDSSVDYCGASDSCDGDQAGTACDPDLQACVAGSCQALGQPTSCKAIKTGDPAATDGVYAIDPDGSAGPGESFEVYCDMTTDDGGWTLLGTISGGDANNWNVQIGLWGDTTLLGTPAAPFDDFKSQAWLDLPITTAEFMIERRYDGVVRAQTKIDQPCALGNSRFVEIFDTYDTTRCALSNVTTITAAADATGLSGDAYIEGTGGNALGGAATNGWCWNGGDNISNTFRGHLGWNQIEYNGCVDEGHLGYLGVYNAGVSGQYTAADITGTNWLTGTTYSLTSVSVYARAK
ncbi:MAG: hypothetical protein KJO07_18640 [Deltaproteobacteria bacterium]|nr:hypothetical protein [Deltaproteobacteria bacterium]